MGLQIFGYAGCTTVKKAVEWAKDEGLEPDYSHFTKVDDLSAALQNWSSKAGIDKVFNTKAQTFKKMDEADQRAVTKDEASMIKAMAADPRLIKRPVGTDGNTVLTGFDKEAWQKTFA